MNRVLVAAVGVVLAAPALAQEVRWTNAAGGIFTEGSNWEGGLQPSTTQYGRFDLGGTFTVSTTGTTAPQVHGLRFYGGETTINAANGIRLSEVTIGDTSGVRTVVILNGYFGEPAGAFGVPEVTLRNAELRGGNPLGNRGSIRLYDHSEFATSASLYLTGISASVTADATSTVRLSGASAYMEGFYSSGPVSLTGTALSLNGFSQTGGSITAVGGSITSDNGGVSGNGTHTFTNTSFRVNNSTGFGGDVTFTGSAATVTSGWVILGAGTFRLRDGARIGAGTLRINNLAVCDVGGGCRTGAVDLFAGGTLRVTGTSSVNNSSWGNVNAQGGAMFFSLDAAAAPVLAPVSLASSQQAVGTLDYVVANPERLHIGDVIPMVEIKANTTSNLIVPAPRSLQGNRLLQVVTTPIAIQLRVMPGGTMPCWTDDFNGDGDVGTDQDIEAFFACLAGNCCATCGTADFNGDGDVGTDGDIEAFFRVLAGGAC